MCAPTLACEAHLLGKLIELVSKELSQVQKVLIQISCAEELCQEIPKFPDTWTNVSFDFWKTDLEMLNVKFFFLMYGR